MANHQKVSLVWPSLRSVGRSQAYWWRTEQFTARKAQYRLYYTDRYWDFVDRWGDALRTCVPR